MLTQKNSQLTNIINEIFGYFRKNFRINCTNLDVFRNNPNKNSSGYVHDNQIRSALRILYKFLNNERYCILQSQMQSGKSGAILALIYILRTYPKILEKLRVSQKRIFILSGMNLVELKNQYKEDAMLIVGDKMSDNILLNGDMRTFVNASRSKTTKLLKNLPEHKKELIASDLKDSIIFIDESHYGATRYQTLDIFSTHKIKHCFGGWCRVF